ncbi:MAG: hypothetical protein KJ714_00405 [Euryarchaeota archaeon]|nr:hypothetical protein [Euryarchaeota archaeon]
MSSKHAQPGVSRWLFLGMLVLLTATPACALPVDDIASLSVQVPYGLKEGKGLAVESSSFQAFFSVESFYHGDLNVELKIIFPKEFEIEEPGEYSFVLQTEYDNWFKFIRINIPENSSGIYSITTIANISTESESWYIERESLVRVVSEEEISKIIRINKVIIPSSEEGKETQYQENSLVLKETSPLLKKLFKAGKSEFEFTPISYAGIEVQNTGEENAIILVSFEVLDTERNPVIGFKPPSHGGGANFSFAAINFKANSKEIIPLPVYADEDLVLGGEYIARSTAKVFGSDFPASVKEDFVKVIARNWTAIYITIFTFIFAIAAFPLFLSKYDVIFRNFKTRHLVMISLFGTVAFAAVTVPMEFIGEVVRAMLGPFSFLITGIFYEIVLYAIITSLIILIPKIGVISILLLVRFILGGVIFGNFGPVMLLLFCFQAIMLEAALYLTGITRGIKLEERRVLLGINLGVADALNSYVSFNLTMCLYRLFYADWYIITHLAISGFLYTFIGVLLGITLGKKLKKVVE